MAQLHYFIPSHIRRIATSHEAPGKGPPKQCSRFLQGLCLRNKRGVHCNLLHDVPGAWIENKCTIRCRLHPHKKIPGVCLNGPSCLFVFISFFTLSA